MDLVDMVGAVMATTTITTAVEVAAYLKHGSDQITEIYSGTTVTDNTLKE